MRAKLWGTTFLMSAFISTFAMAEDVITIPQKEDAEVVIVTGKGVRQTQTLKAEILDSKTPGTSPIKLVERLPGVNYSGADAFGAYEWAVRISVRGFAQQQMGFTLDGVPLGDMSYGNFNGLHVSRALISENLAEVKMSQGAGLLSTNSTSNIGGTLQFVSKLAEEKRKLYIAGTIGTEQFARLYGRFDTGSIETLGNARFYVSAMTNEVDKWKGGGAQKQKQFNAGFTFPIGDGAINGLYTNSFRREADYQDLSKEMINRLGYEWDNFAPNWQLAQLVADIGNNRGDTGAPITNAAAGTIYPNPVGTIDDAYFDASGLRDDELMRFGYNGNLGENFELDMAVYNHQQKGQGLWFTPYVSPFSFGLGTAGVTSPISVRTTEYDMSRYGGFANLTYHFGNHAIEGGLWLEKNKFNQARRFYANTRTTPNSVMHFQKNAFATQWAQNYNTETQVFHLQDTWQVNDLLRIVAGFKSMKITTDGITPINNFAAPVAGSDGDLKGTIVSEDTFLPQIGLTYDLANNYQFFAGYTENMRAFDLAPFSNRSQIAFEAIKKRTNPESSKTIETGLRLRNKNFQGVITAYYVKFDDRLLAIRQGAGILGNPSVISNVGGVETKGVEIAGNYKFMKHFNIYASYAYNDSKYEDNVTDATGAILQTTKDKTVVNAPKNLLKTDFIFDNGKFFASLSANYTSERESTYTNIGGKIDANTIVDLTAGMRLDGMQMLDGTEIQLNVTNLFDEKYISTIGTNGFNASDAAENAQTFMVGAPQTVSLTLRKTF